MKSTLLAVAGILLMFISWPIGIYQGYLMYTHVHATELMWFVWIINIPLSLSMAVIGVLIRESAKK